MLEKYYEEIKQNINVRENLSLIRGAIKNQEGLAHFLQLAGDGKVLTDLLASEDAKTRKNAALLLGDMELADAAGALWSAYEGEQTLFVKSAYLTALGKIGAEEYLDAYRARLAVLTAMDAAENEKKHIGEEIRALEKNIVALCGATEHTFVGWKEAHKILLTTNHEQREATLSEIDELPATVRRRESLHPLGVQVETPELRPFTRLRTYRELLFFVDTDGRLTGTPAQMAAAVWKSDFADQVRACHKEDAPFYFRLEIKGRMEQDEKGEFARRFCREFEQLSGRTFLNSTSDYEVEIRLVQTKDGSFVPFYKLSTLKIKRFAYRKNAIATSIHPATAAMLMQIAKPYLKEHAQILDPFCGVGTMLIERDIRVPAREKYGIDIFGDAIRMARENAAAAGEQIHFINRDYFDFKHDYLFDEIVTNMPVRGRKTKEEMDAFYAKFFRKSKEILRDGAVVILYSNEEGFIKKQLRLTKEYRLLAEHCIRSKEHFYLYIIQYQGQ